MKQLIFINSILNSKNAPNPKRSNDVEIFSRIYNYFINNNNYRFYYFMITNRLKNGYVFLIIL